jgi:hypothetical protein
MFKKKKPNKYRNIKVGGYDSKKEARRAVELKMLERTGLIKSLEEQVPFILVQSFKGKDGITERGVKYYADFVYYDVEKKSLVIEDVKSDITKKKPEYVIKRKLVKKSYPDYLFIET